MVQLGNVHFGKAHTAIEPTISIMEAGLLWDMTTARYKCLEETQLYFNYAHDKDLKALLGFGLDFLEKQVNILEEQMNLFRLPMPNRPPKNINQTESKVALNDRFIFAQVFEGCQAFIDHMARVSRSMLTNDPLRHIIVNFLSEELSLFEKQVKFAKLKGWLQVVPLYKPE